MYEMSQTFQQIDLICPLGELLEKYIDKNDKFIIIMLMELGYIQCQIKC